MQVTAAILAKSYEEFSQKAEKLSQVASRIQIDLSDGMVGKEISWLPDGSEILPYTETIAYEFDVMVDNWRDVLSRVLLFRPGGVVMHIDSFEDADCNDLINMISPTQMQLGLSCSNDSGLTEFKEKVMMIREKYPNIFIQVMGIRNIGAQGQIFDEECLARVKDLKQTFGETYLQVDGGMRPETAVKVLHAGADGIVVGSYLLRHDDLNVAMSTLVSIE